MRAFVVERVERLRSEPAGDLVAALAKPLPSFVVAHYLGVPGADRDRFDDWTEEIVGANSSGDPLGAVEAVAELAAYFSELIEHRRGTPGDDVVSDLVTAMDDPVTRRGLPGHPGLRLHHGGRGQRHDHRPARRRRRAASPSAPPSGGHCIEDPRRSPARSRSSCASPRRCRGWPA